MLMKKGTRHFVSTFPLRFNEELRVFDGRGKLVELIIVTRAAAFTCERTGDKKWDCRAEVRT